MCVCVCVRARSYLHLYLFTQGFRYGKEESRCQFLGGVQLVSIHRFLLDRLP